MVIPYHLLEDHLAGSGCHDFTTRIRLEEAAPCYAKGASPRGNIVHKKNAVWERWGGANSKLFVVFSFESSGSNTSR